LKSVENSYVNQNVYHLKSGGVVEKSVENVEKSSKSRSIFPDSPDFAVERAVNIRLHNA